MPTRRASLLPRLAVALLCTALVSGCVARTAVKATGAVVSTAAKATGAVACTAADIVVEDPRCKE